MFLKQFYLGCLAQASYMIGDPSTSSAVVVDPRRDVDEYLVEAERQGLTIEHVVLTHFHADFLAGHLELRERTGARIYLGAKAGQTEFEYQPLRDGDAIELGRVRVVALETPGHTPEGISLLVYDQAQDADHPHAVLTGDTLFIGDVGRPDLMASVGMTAEELASQLYDSLHQKLLPLPDATVLYPGHGAGSACGKNLSNETVSTIGAQRLKNYALQPMSREAFVEAITSGQRPAPAYFAYDAQLNRRRRPVLEEALKAGLKPLDLDAVLALIAEGAQAVDVRDPDAFAKGHLRGSINIGLGGKFASWAGTLLDPHKPIVLVADPGREEEAAMRLGRIGFDAVAGYLGGGPAGLAGRPDLHGAFDRIDSGELWERLAGPHAPTVLDVRTPGEREGGAIPGSLHVPLDELRDRMTEVPQDTPLVLYCRSGYRSAVATSLLERRGYAELADLRGGWLAWQEALPT